MPKPATGPVLDPAAVRAHSLAKQGLAGAGFPDVPAALSGTGGVYGASPTAYLSLAARIRGFHNSALDRELYERRTAVRVRCMHEMVYVVGVDRVAELVAATEPGDKAVTRILRVSGMTSDEYADLADRVDAALSGGEATVAELRDTVGPLRDAGHLQYAVALMGRQCRLVRARPRGSWRSDSHSYARWADWLGAPVDLPDAATARTALARHYLRALGPATTADLKWWAGWTVRDTTAALDALGAEITPVRLGEAQGWLLADELDTLSTVEPVGGVRLLPVWDAYAMGYADRSRIVEPALRGRVIDRIGNATSMVLVDGQAAGVWELADNGPGQPATVRVAPFRPLPKSRWTEVEAEARRIADALDASELAVVRESATGELDEAGRNAFHHPITRGAG